MGAADMVTVAVASCAGQGLGLSSRVELNVSGHRLFSLLHPTCTPSDARSPLPLFNCPCSFGNFLIMSTELWSRPVVQVGAHARDVRRRAACMLVCCAHPFPKPIPVDHNRPPSDHSELLPPMDPLMQDWVTLCIMAGGMERFRWVPGLRTRVGEGHQRCLQLAERRHERV